MSQVVTLELLAAGASSKGGWSREQLHILGVPWPPPSGWKKRVIGQSIPPHEAEKFVALKGA